MRKMGLIKYYLFPCWRQYYDPDKMEYISEEEMQRRAEGIL